MSTIAWTLSGPLAYLSLDRPAKRNALRMEDWRSLAARIVEMLAAGPQAVIVRSAGPGAFCAGSDLQEITALAEDRALRAQFQAVMRDAMELLASASVPTLAAIGGDCFGAGVALAMACDVRVAAATARFGITPAKFGISYPAEDIRRLRDLVGPGHAARLLYGAETIDGREAARIGLVEILADDPLAEAEAAARRMCANSPASIARLKQTLRSSGAAAPDQQFLDSFDSDDFRRFIAKP